MSIQVHIPTILRDYTAGAKAVDAQGMTVSEVLADLERRFPRHRVPRHRRER